MNLILKLTLLFLSACVHKPAHKALTNRPTKTTDELMKSAQDSDWRTPGADNLLYMKLKSGLVIIELFPEQAPDNVANIKKLTNHRYWDGLAVIRSQPNYVAQWGDPSGKKNRELASYKDVQQKVQPEFVYRPSDGVAGPFFKFVILPDTDTYADEVGFIKGFPMARLVEKNELMLAHCYGTVGVSRDQAIDSGNGSSLYAVTGHSPRHLDGNITTVGRVLYGMEHLVSLPPGKGDLGFYQDQKKHHPIEWARLESQVPAKAKKKIRVLKTDTPLFAELIKSRRFRREAWFHHPAGRLGLCNMPVAVEVK